MKAAVLHGNKDLRYEEIDTPEVSKGEVRIKVAMCGICGSDIPRVFENAAHNYPIVLGHEFSGSIDEIGEGVTGFNIGDKVVAAPLLPCGECEDCKNGNYSLCAHYGFIGSRNMGAMADYLLVPAQNVVKVPDNLSFEDAASIEPSTVAAHAMKQAKMKEGDSVAIIGGGIIGLYTLQWAKIYGASHITMISRGSTGLDAAKVLGADKVVTTKDKTDEEIIAELESVAYDKVFDCSAVESLKIFSLKIVKNKGTVCYVGTPKKEMTITVKEWELINRKECYLTGSWMSYSAPFPGSEWTDSVKYLAEGRLKVVKGMVQGYYPMSDAMKAFDEIYEGRTKGRVILTNI